LFEPGEFSAMKNFDLLLNFVFFLELKTKERRKMGKAYSLPSCPDQLAVTKNFIFLYPMTFCITSGGKFWYPECSEILSDEI
jgi:hypothetical protein